MVTAKPSAKWRLFIVGGPLLGLAFIPLPQNSTYLICGFRWLTGMPCPLCGMTRALSLLLKGQWTQALRLHPLSPVVLAILISACLSVVVQWISKGRFSMGAPDRLS